VLEAAVLFVGSLSVVVDVTLALLRTVEKFAALGLTVTTITTLKVALALTVPMAHVTVVVPLQLPADGVALTSVVPAGRTSLTVTPAAALGP